MNPSLNSVASRYTSRQMYARLLSWVKPYWPHFGLAILGMVLTASTEPMFPALMKYLLDNGFVAKNKELTLLIPLAMVLIFLFRGLANFMGDYALAWVASRVVMDLRRAMFSRLLILPTRFYDDQSTGAVISKVAYDVTNVSHAATGVLTTMVRDGLAVLGMLAYLLYLDWKLTMIALTVGPLVFGVMRVFGKRLRKASRSGYAAMGLIAHILEETVGAHQVVKVFGGQNYEAGRFREATNQSRRAAMREAIAAAATAPLTQLAASFAVAIITYLALEQSARDAGTTVGTFISFFIGLVMLLTPMKRLSEVNAPLQRGLAAAESVFQVLDEVPEEDDGTIQLGRARGHIRFEGVGFAYPGVGRPALFEIDLDIEPGQTVALVGASGSGKTTMAALIPRFYHPSSGRILIDGHAIEELTLNSLRANIALVSQDVVLFNDTVRANIAYGAASPASEEEVIAAAKAANAWEFIEQMEQGLDTEVGENGVKLSGGQRQRLAIARAFLKDAPILILDEATSALDSESELQIQSGLDQLIQGRTTLVIAHRLSTVEKADLIVVLDQGRIVERGTHAELLARQAVYARMHQLQRESRSG
ncbi:MAG: Lipid A export ATP-binding/permease protein MsbA [Betaproteobacteria bacterium ADurb.Bin341]|nr:MAG: Lipid A export ATP-binding/permease protein MsbA [Betaproteobacteria bacterium ADurb.Bin341]